MQQTTDFSFYCFPYINTVTVRSNSWQWIIMATIIMKVMMTMMKNFTQLSTVNPLRKTLSVLVMNTSIFTGKIKIYLKLSPFHQCMPWPLLFDVLTLLLSPLRKTLTRFKTCLLWNNAGECPHTFFLFIVARRMSTHQYCKFSNSPRAVCQSENAAESLKRNMGLITTC